MPTTEERFKLVSDFTVRGDQVHAIPELVEGSEPRRRPPGAARRHRLGQDLHDGAGRGRGEPADARDGAQQDAGRAALPGVPALLPRERRRVLRQLLRLLPARGLRAGHRLVHREGGHDQRRDRPDAPVGHAVALRAPRRHHRRQRVVHLRPGLARGLLRHDAAARRRGSASSATTSCASWSRFSTSATTSSSAAARSACAATSSRSCRRTKSTRSASASSATRWTSSPGSTRSPARCSGASRRCRSSRSRTSWPRATGRVRPSRRSRPSSTQRRGDLESEGKLLEAQRLHQRTMFDLEMMREIGYCHGIENYSRHLTGRAPGEPPPTLFDYLPDDALLIVDESHQTVPQIRGMYLRRPLAQGSAGVVRVPPAVGARQPPAQLRGVGGARAADGLRLGHAGPLRAGEGAGRGGRAGDPADRADGSADRGAAGEGAGGRPAAGDPRAGRRSASAFWSPR